eukprot:6477211-Amphidinium_carterae.1
MGQNIEVTVAERVWMKMCQANSDRTERWREVQKETKAPRHEPSWAATPAPASHVYHLISSRARSAGEENKTMHQALTKMMTEDEAVGADDPMRDICSDLSWDSDTTMWPFLLQEAGKQMSTRAGEGPGALVFLKFGTKLPRNSATHKDALFSKNHHPRFPHQQNGGKR